MVRTPLTLAAAALVSVVCAAQTATTPALFVLQRNHRLTVYDPATLVPFGAFVTEGLGDGLSVRDDGLMVFLLQPLLRDPNGCCSLRSLDLETRRMCVANELQTSLPRAEMSTPSGEVVVFQRNGSGLHMMIEPVSSRRGGADLIDPKTKVILRRIQPTVFFRDLIISRNGRTLFGVEDWPRGVPVRLLRIDVATGAIDKEIRLTPREGPDTLVEQWSLAVANVPVNGLPRGEVQPRPCQ